MSAIIETLTTTLQAAPGNWQYRLALVEALVAEGQTVEACKVLRVVTELPEDHLSQLYAARAWGILEPMSGIEILDRIVLANPTFAQAYLEKAKLLCAMGDYYQASGNYQVAVKIDPSLSDPDLAAQLGEPGSSEPSRITTSQHALPKGRISKTSPEARDVYYPAPGELPVITLSQALSMPPRRPLVPPESIPDLPALDYTHDVAHPETTYVKRPEFYARLRNVDVHPAGHHDGITYDYQQPDDTIFEPTITDDEIYVVALVTDTGQPVASLQESIRRHRDTVKKEIEKKERLEKSQSVVAAMMAVAGICALLMLVVQSLPPRKPPQIVARVVAPVPEEVVERVEVRKADKVITPASSSLPTSLNMVTAATVSEISAQSFETPITGLGDPTMGNSFGASMSFGNTTGGGSAMFMGTKTKGETAVIFDVSGSMYREVPEVVKEIKRAFKRATVVAVMGCQLAPRKADDDHRLIDPKENEQLLNWIQVNGAKIPELRDAMKKSLFSLENTVSLSEETTDAPLGVQNLGRAIEMLVKKPPSMRPSTIFVFADFEDSVSDAYLADLKSLLKRRGTKIVFYQAKERFRNANTQATLEAFVEGLDGEVKIGL